MKFSLEKLKKEVGQAEKSGRGWLYTPRGRRLLKRARSMNLAWPALTRLFRRSQGRLEKMFSFHHIRKSRPEFLSWNNKIFALVKKFYKKSVGIQTVHDSSRLSMAMFQAVNMERKRQGLGRISLNGIRCFAKDHSLRWGWHTRIGKRPFSEKEKTILRQRFAGSSWSDITSLLPRRSVEEIRSYARRLGLKRPRSAYSEAEMAILRQAIEDSKKIQDEKELSNFAKTLETKLGRSFHGIKAKMAMLGFKLRHQLQTADIVHASKSVMWQP